MSGIMKTASDVVIQKFRFCLTNDILMAAAFNIEVSAVILQNFSAASAPEDMLLFAYSPPGSVRTN